MIAYSGLIGLTVIYSTAGFTAGPISTPSRSKGSCGRACASYQPVARHRAPQLDAGWRLPTKQQAVRSWPMRAAADGTGDTEPAAEAAPRLKRVRKRRKDASPIATAGEDEDGVEPSSPAGEQAAAAAAVDFESARAEAAAAVMAVEEPEPEAVVMPVAAQKVEQAVEGAPRSAGDTRGTKVRVDNSDDYISEQLADAASAASGAAGSAASAVSGAAKSAMNAAMSAIGQGGGEDMADDFDIDNIPAPSANTRRRTTPGKSAAELADLGADIERFRKIENRQPMGAGESFALGAKDLISTIITVDFFVVIVFMLWFIAGIVSSYGFSNTFLLDQFNDKWTPVVQPALGVLMGGTIAGGVVSKLGESGDDEEKR